MFLTFEKLIMKLNLLYGLYVLNEEQCKRCILEV